METFREEMFSEKSETSNILKKLNSLCTKMKHLTVEVFLNRAAAAIESRISSEPLQPEELFQP